MVVIGFEKLEDHRKTLLVLDPKYHNADLNTRLHLRKPRPGELDKWLSLYRRDASYFKRHAEFEMIT
jgi:hypothetical protein